MTAGSSLSGTIESLTQVARFYKDRAEYQAECEIQAALEEHRKSLYASDSSKMRTDTVELAKCKLKLQLLEAEMKQLPECLATKFTPFVEMFTARITDLRKDRRAIASC